jgi:CelD/BcsL family acetyltransferase involved in cellulose biosynthesis
MTDSIAAISPLANSAPLTWENLPASALQQRADIGLEWNRLNAARGDLPFLSADAIGIALEIFGEGRERLLIGHSGAVVAMLVLVPQTKLRWSTFQPSQIPLGAWVAEPDISAAALANSLVKSQLGLCLVLSITQIDPRFALRGVDSANSEHSDYIATGWVDVEGSFEQYWSARGKNLRQNMRKQRNKLAAEGTSTCLKVWAEPQQMAPALARYAAMESVGWKSARGTAIQADNDQGRFYTRLFENAAARGEAVIYEYLFNDKSVAMNLCLRRNGMLVVLKTTYDESIKHLSPAFLLREEELKATFEAGQINRIEYYGRLMDWHTKLTDNKRTLFHLTVYRWPLVKQLAVWRRKLRTQVPLEQPSQEQDLATRA